MVVVVGLAVAHSERRGCWRPVQHGHAREFAVHGAAASRTQEGKDGCVSQNRRTHPPTAPVRANVCGVVSSGVEWRRDAVVASPHPPSSLTHHSHEEREQVRRGGLLAARHNNG